MNLSYSVCWGNTAFESILVHITVWASIRDLLYKVIFQDPDCWNAGCWAEKYPKTKEPNTLISFGSTQSQEKRPQGLDFGRSTASNQTIANLDLNFDVNFLNFSFIYCPKFDKAFLLLYCKTETPTPSLGPVWNMTVNQVNLVTR